MGNYIGTDKDGVQQLSNGGNGVLAGSYARIGENASSPGELPGNIIAANNMNGVAITGDPTGVYIYGNRIGVSSAGLGLGNDGHGVVFPNGYKNNHVGSASEGDGNEIAFNGGDGVFIDGATTAVGIRGNSIHDNDGLGIDLAPNGVTGNDDLDGDVGPNALLNFPVIELAETGSLHVEGTLDSSDMFNEFAIDFYAQKTCDSEGNGEGLEYLGSVQVFNDGPASVPFEVTLPVSVPGGDFITATATLERSSANQYYTSEFSDCRIVVQGPTSPPTTPPVSPPTTPAVDPVEIRGDADCDEDIDLFDALEALKDIGGLPAASCIDQADVNCNGLVEQDDLVALIRNKAGLPVATPPPSCQAIGQPIP
jgi:hypothetical protein